MIITESRLRQIIREHYTWTLVVEARESSNSIAIAIANFIRVNPNLINMKKNEFVSLIKDTVAKGLNSKGMDPSTSDEIEKFIVHDLSKTGDVPRVLAYLHMPYVGQIQDRRKHHRVVG